MAWNGLGAYVLAPAYSPEANGTLIDATRYNGLMNDIKNGITACLAKNGENAPTANLPMGGFKHTGAIAATASGQYLTYDQDNAVVRQLSINKTTAGTPLSVSGLVNNYQAFFQCGTVDSISFRWDPTRLSLQFGMGTVSHAGILTYGSTTMGGIVLGQSGSLALYSFPGYVGGETHVVNATQPSFMLPNITVTPTAIPTGGIIYVEGGALKYRGGSGTITTLAPA